MAALPARLLLPLVLGALAVREDGDEATGREAPGGLLELEPRLGREDELVVDGQRITVRNWAGKADKAQKSGKKYTKLFVSTGVELGPGVLEAMVDGLKKLEQVKLQEGTLRLTGHSCLVALQNLKDLKYLHIGADNGLGSEGATALAKTLYHCKKLEHLSIGGKNNIQVAGAKALATQLRQSPELKWIEIGLENHIGDEGFNALLKLPKLSSMNIDRDKNDITRQDVFGQNQDDVVLELSDLRVLRGARHTAVQLAAQERDPVAEFQFPQTDTDALEFPYRAPPYDWSTICKDVETKQLGFDKLVIEERVKISGDKLKDLLGKLGDLTSVKIRGNNGLADSSQETRTEDGFGALGTLQKLEELVIGDGNKLNSDGAEAFVESLGRAQKQSPMLKILEIGANNVLSQVGAEAIAKIPLLIELKIGEDNYLGSGGAKALAGLKNLLRVEIGANNLVGHGGLEGVKALASLTHLVELKIYKAGNGVNATTDLTVEGDTELLQMAGPSKKLQLL